MKRLLSITFLFLIFKTPVQAQNDWQERFTESWQRNLQYTLAILEKMPEAKLNYKPTEESMTFREQLAHLANNFASLQSYITDSDHQELKSLATAMKGQGKAALSKSISQAYLVVDTIMANLDYDQLNEKVSFFDQNANMTRLDVLYLIKEHLAHHRGQLSMYLRMNGIKPPKYVGW